MPNKNEGMSDGGGSASQQPDREEVQQWEDEGGAPKAPAKPAKSGGKKPAAKSTSRSRTGR